jgi:PAS domain S-box-containing protein
MPTAASSASRRSRAILAARLQGERRLAAIVESSDDAIIAKDLNGVITAWNHAAERCSATRRRGHRRSIRIIVPDDRQDEETRFSSGSGAVNRRSTSRPSGAGRRRLVPEYLPDTVSPILDDLGAVIGASKIARDVTQRKRLDEQAAV